MKKIIALSTLFALSSIAVAQGFQDPNDSRTQNAAEGQNAPVMSADKPNFPEMKGKHHFDGKHPKFGGKHPKFDGKAPKAFKPAFFDESLAVKSVKDIPAAKDKAFVMMEGKIVKQVGKDDFLFRDASGEIEIEVSRRAWFGQTVTPNDTVEIRGILDKEWEKTEIEVKQIIKK